MLGGMHEYVCVCVGTSVLCACVDNVCVSAINYACVFACVPMHGWICI